MYFSPIAKPNEFGKLNTKAEWIRIIACPMDEKMKWLDI